LLGKKNVIGKPRIEAIVPSASTPGGEIRIVGSQLRPIGLRRPQVLFGDTEGAVLVSADDFLVARVPEGAGSGPLVISTDGIASNPCEVQISVPVAENLHPVANPVIDREGNIFATFSGQRGQKVPVSIYRIDTNYNVKPFVTELMNATGMAFDRAGQMYVSSRFEGAVYRVTPKGVVSAYAEGMGVATGIAFDAEENLYVGDRSGTIFKIARDRQTFVFATLEPSISAYHLAFGPGGNLYVTGPTRSSFEAVHCISPQGETSVFYRGLGRPQGLAFDTSGNLYVAASLAGQRGIVRISPEGKASLAIAGHNLVGLAFAPGRSAVLATTNAVHHLTWDVQGQVLP
jgi:sugar lactone lactonase YvrE